MLFLKPAERVGARQAEVIPLPLGKLALSNAFSLCPFHLDPESQTKQPVSLVTAKKII
jgi:hypothetical protein